jgi:uncharacterized membrane protein (DUF485 family)
MEDHAPSRILIKKLIDRKGEDAYKDFAPEFAVIAGIPVFTVYFYIGEIIGFNPWLITRMKAVSKFYGYTEIISDYNIDLKQFTDRK